MTALRDVAQRAPLWKVALIGFVAMFLADVLATAEVVFESHFNAPLAGSMDVLGYFAGLACSVVALDSILKDGWRNRRSLTIIAAISVANFAGTYAGVYLSRGIL